MPKWNSEKEMRRIIAAIIYFFLSVLAAMAGDSFFHGTWVGIRNETDVRNYDGVDAFSDVSSSITMNFSEDGYTQTVNVVLTMKLNRKGGDVEGSLKVVAKSTHLGTWDSNEGVLSLSPEKKKKPKVVIETESKDFPGGGLVRSIVASVVKKDILRHITFPSSYKILSQTDNQMTLKDLVVAKRNPRGNKPDRVTFNRK